MCLAHIKKKLCHCRVINRTSKQTDNLLHVACFSEDLKCGEAWDINCGQKAKAITPSIAWRREAWKEKALDDLPWKDETGPSSIRRTLEPFQRQRRKTSERQGGAHMGFSERTDAILNWTELNGTEQLSFEYLLNVRARNPRYEFKSSVRYSTTIPPAQPPCSQTGIACWMFDDG